MPYGGEYMHHSRGDYMPYTGEYVPSTGDYMQNTACISPLHVPCTPAHSLRTCKHAPLRPCKHAMSSTPWLANRPRANIPWYVSHVFLRAGPRALRGCVDWSDHGRWGHDEDVVPDDITVAVPSAHVQHAPAWPPVLSHGPAPHRGSRPLSRVDGTAAQREGHGSIDGRRRCVTSMRQKCRTALHTATSSLHTHMLLTLH